MEDSSPVCQEKEASEAAQLEREQVQVLEGQWAVWELVHFQVLSEFTQAETDMALNFTVPLSMAMVLTDGAIPALEAMVTAT